VEEKKGVEIRILFLGVEKGGAFLRPIDKIRLWPVRAALAVRRGLGATRKQAYARTASL